MGNRKMLFVIALLLTILDAVVGWRYGGLIWGAWSGIVWYRLLLVLLASLGAATLSNVWAHAFEGLGFASPKSKEWIVLGVTRFARELQGDRDV